MTRTRLAHPTTTRVVAFIRKGLPLALTLSVLVCALAHAPRVQAADAPSEYEVKAALLFNFAKFVEWPGASFATPDAPFTIGVVGNDPFGPALERMLAGKTVGGRAIVIRRWRKAENRGPCQLLFVGASERDHLTQILDGVRVQPVLTVGDTHAFAAHGGMIGLTMADNRVRFEINESRANEANLSVSSRLLSLARIVTAAR